MKIIEKDYQEKCISLNIDYQKNINKRFIITAAIVILAIISFITVDYVSGVVIAVMGIVVYKMDYYHLLKKHQNKILNKQLEFTNFFSFLIIFLERKFNLYQALSSSEDYLENEFHLLIQEFKEEINGNTSIGPYLKFANQFASDSITEIMVILYQYEQNGGSEVELRNFASSLQKLHDNEIDEYIKSSTLAFDYYSFLPLLVSAVIATTFAIAILSNVGGLLNV